MLSPAQNHITLLCRLYDALDDALHAILVLSHHSCARVRFDEVFLDFGDSYHVFVTSYLANMLRFGKSSLYYLLNWNLQLKTCYRPFTMIPF